MLIARVATAYYFAHFLIVLPVLSRIEKTEPLPLSITEPVLTGMPKAELIKRLQEYQRFKAVSLEIDELPRVDRDVFGAAAKLPEFVLPKPKNFYDKNDLSFALRSILEQLNNTQSHKVTLENISVESKMKLLLESLKTRDFISLPELVLKGESKLAISVILVAALELNRKGYIEVVQAEQFGELYFKNTEEILH